MGLNVTNVLVYVDDAVRWDALSDRLASLGPTYKTVAASTHTPTSFGSLLTGLLPPNSGILSFKHRVPSAVRSVFDLESHTTTLAAEGGMNDALAEVFGHPPRARVEDVDPPFVHVVRRPGGHAPYDGFDWDRYEYQDETALEYLLDVATDPERARRDYARGVERSFEEFERVLDVLDRRGLAEDTLVVYTSDHGELLGEYGFFGHTHLATPEVVYVPTTFVHPELSPSREDGLLHHVDLLPSVEQHADVADVGDTDGTPFGEGRVAGTNYFTHVRYEKIPERLESVVSRFGGFERTVRSLWDRDGGHVFVDGSSVTTSLVYLYLLLRLPFGRQVRHAGSVTDTYRRFLPGHQSYGSPAFTSAEAEAELNRLRSTGTTETVHEIDDQRAEQLREMGYL